jgi:hypothetical protein
MSMAAVSHGMFLLVQATLPPPPPPSNFGTQEMLSASANYLAQMQSLIAQMQTTVSALAVIVTVITSISALLAIAFTAAGYFAQRRAQEEIKQVRLESANEIAERHHAHQEEMKLHKIEMKLLYDGMDAKVRNTASGVLDEYDERVQRTYSAEILHTLEKIESSYASNLRQIEDVLITFQDECYVMVNDSTYFDFARYNTFRHLLTRLVSGGRYDTHSALSRILEEYAPQIGQSTAELLRALVDGLSKSGRLSRAEQRILVGRILFVLDERFPRADVEEEEEEADSA